jgi:hypothetical protein
MDIVIISVMAVVASCSVLWSAGGTAASNFNLGRLIGGNSTVAMAWTRRAGAISPHLLLMPSQRSGQTLARPSNGDQPIQIPFGCRYYVSQVDPFELFRSRAVLQRRCLAPPPKQVALSLPRSGASRPTNVRTK